MISNLDNIAILAIGLATIMTIAATEGLVLLVTFNTILVIAGVLLGPALRIAGLNFSTGDVFVAIAMFGLAIHHHLYGRQEALRALDKIFLALTIVFVTLFLLDHASLLSPMFDASIRTAGVRLICIYLVKSLVIHLLDKPSLVTPVIRIPAVVMLSEMLEGLIFYPCILLGEWMPALVVEYTISSIGTRLMTTMLAVPFLIVFLVLESRGVVGKCARAN